MENLTLEQVANRRKCLAKYKLWDAPSTDDIEGWVGQFKSSSDNDKSLAKVTLDALTVRSGDSALSALFVMLCSVIPNVINNNLIFTDKSGAIPYDMLRKKQFINDFRILRLERPTNDHAEGQSSDNIIGNLRYNYAVNSKYFEEPDNSIKNVLLVDEFSGSGNQAKNAISDWQKYLSPGTKISVFFMAIHENGLSDLQTQFRDVKIYAAELLGQESCLLTHINNYFKLNSIEQSKKMLADFINRNFVKENGKPPLGYKEMCLCFKPPYTACNNMAGVYLLKTKQTNVRLFDRGL